MLGYWEKGKRRTEIPPASKMGIDITQAKIGRLMKKRAMQVVPRQVIRLKRQTRWGGVPAASASFFQRSSSGALEKTA